MSDDARDTACRQMTLALQSRNPEPDASPTRERLATLVPVGTEIEMLSNTFTFWEKIPKYVEAKQQHRQRRDGVLKSLKREFESGGKRYTLRVHPARVRAPGTEEHVEWLPSPSDQLVEHALVRLFIARHGGAVSCGKAPDLFVRFRLRELWQILKQHKHTRSYDELRQALDVLSGAVLELDCDGRRTHREPILSALSVPADDEGIFVARFHMLIAQAVRVGEYRQFPLDRWFAQRRSLARWLFTRLVCQSNLAPSHPHRVSVTEARSAGMTDSARVLDDVKAMRQAWSDLAGAGLVEPEPPTSFTDDGGRRRTARQYEPIRHGRTLVDAIFTLVPTQLACSHVVAENVRRLELNVPAAARPALSPSRTRSVL